MGVLLRSRPHENPRLLVEHLVDLLEGAGASFDAVEISERDRGSANDGPDAEVTINDQCARFNAKAFDSGLASRRWS